MSTHQRLPHRCVLAAPAWMLPFKLHWPCPPTLAFTPRGNVRPVAGAQARAAPIWSYGDRPEPGGRCASRQMRLRLCAADPAADDRHVCHHVSEGQMGRSHTLQLHVGDAWMWRQSGALPCVRLTIAWRLLASGTACPRCACTTTSASSGGRTRMSSSGRGTCSHSSSWDSSARASSWRGVAAQAQLEPWHQLQHQPQHQPQRQPEKQARCTARATRSIW